ncbi:MAG: septal ring lytic transglycosylase RlpA family protein [Actinomycetota bacterium]
MHLHRMARALGPLALAVVVAAVVVQPAAAGDLDSLRARAQLLADEVTGLERGLADLGTRRAQLQEAIARASREIGLLELELHDNDAAFRQAESRYVERAVELYKSGSATRLALLLSAKTLDQMLDLEKATSASNDAAADALRALRVVRARNEAAQDRVDARKQRLMAAEAEAAEVGRAMADAIAARRDALASLTVEIRRLEAEARRQAVALAAARAQTSGSVARPGAALLDILRPSGPASGIPKGFAGTGVSFEGVASWYGPGFEGNLTANGDVFDPDLYTAASKELPLGSWLYVEHAGRGVVVLVNDRGPYIDGRVLDLSRAAAQAIGISGLGWIEAEVLIKV